MRMMSGSCAGNSLLVCMLGLSMLCLGEEAMRLPKAEQTKTDQELGQAAGEGRITVTLTKKKEGGGYEAEVDGRSFPPLRAPGGGGPSLHDYLSEMADRRIEKGTAKRDDKGALDFAARIRVPADAPMSAVEGLMMAIARVGIIRLQVAVLPATTEKEPKEAVLPYTFPIDLSRARTIQRLEVLTYRKDGKPVVEYQGKRILLSDLLKRMAAPGGEETSQLRIRYEKETPWEDVVALIDAGIRLKFGEIGMVPLRPGGESVKREEAVPAESTDTSPIKPEKTTVGTPIERIPLDK